ncbi:DUF4136 domain-containing protein [uncultured Microbulbifer sp.]|uniref:DUF4136 domain-containing protein n=1 Tax=uncultured Microbulbifer sp. TaxID=348147 RepID=UPI0025DFCB30|nr:DUF4136 domain-containing protein [uncultured Microbulbifer sp.]
MNIWRSIAVSILLPLALAGCAGTTSTASSSALSQYRTFGFVPASGSNGRAMALARSEVSEQLMARGMTPSKTPDVLVNVHVHAERQVKSRQSYNLGFAAARYPYLEEYYKSLPPGYHADFNQYTAGHLTIDLLDARQRKVVWRGRAQKPITRKVLDNPERAVDQAVNDAFRTFPARAR